MTPYLIELVFPLPEDVSSPLGQLFYFNSLTDVGSGGFVGLGLLILFGFVLWLMMKAFSYEKGLAVSMFITSICGVLMRFVTYQGQSLISDYQMYGCIIIFVISLFLLQKEASQFE